MSDFGGATGLERLEDNSLKGALEALLLVSSEAVSAIDLAKVTGAAPGDVAGALAELSAEYADANRGFQLREVAGGWRFFTHPSYHEQVETLVLSWDKTRLSQAALETLAVIAYHQPVSREGVRAVRGVNSDGVINSLVEKGLVREAGRDRDRGQARLYGTTRSFLERFGLKSLRDLPPLEDFAPDEESKQFIRERLSTRAINLTLDEAADDIEAEAADSERSEEDAEFDVEALLKRDLSGRVDDESEDGIPADADADDTEPADA